MKYLILICTISVLSGCSVDPARMQAANEAGAAYLSQYNQQQMNQAPVVFPPAHSEMLYQMMHNTTFITPTYNGGYRAITN